MAAVTPSRARSWPRWRTCVAAFSLSFLLSFITGAAIFFGLTLVLSFLSARETTPIAYLYRMFMYPDAHPLPYIAVLALPFAALTAFWVTAARTRVPRRQQLHIVAIILASLIISSVLGGMLWVLHDMQAGYFPSADLMTDRFLWGAVHGLLLGPVIVAFSIPMNVLGFLAAFVIAKLTYTIFARDLYKE